MFHKGERVKKWVHMVYGCPLFKRNQMSSKIIPKRQVLFNIPTYHREFEFFYCSILRKDQNNRKHGWLSCSPFCLACSAVLFWPFCLGALLWSFCSFCLCYKNIKKWYWKAISDKLSPFFIRCIKYLHFIS